MVGCPSATLAEAHAAYKDQCRRTGGASVELNAAIAAAKEAHADE